MRATDLLLLAALLSITAIACERDASEEEGNDCSLADCGAELAGIDAGIGACVDSDDCAPDEVCDPCAGASCPVCTDCVAACVPASCPDAPGRPAAETCSAPDEAPFARYDDDGCVTGWECAACTLDPAPECPAGEVPRTDPPGACGAWRCIPGGTFRCGEATCDIGTEACEIAHGGVPVEEPAPSSASCVDLPEECLAAPTCDCAAPVGDCRQGEHGGFTYDLNYPSTPSGSR